EGLRQVGFACGIAVMPAITLVFIHQFGWRWTWMGFSVAVALGFFPLIACFYRNRTLEEGPADGGSADGSSRSQVGLTPTQARKTAAYWGMISLSVWWGVLGTAVAFNAIPLMKESGLRETDGALLLQAFAVSLAVMNISAGLLID